MATPIRLSKGWRDHHAQSIRQARNRLKEQRRREREEMSIRHAKERIRPVKFHEEIDKDGIPRFAMTSTW